MVDIIKFPPHTRTSFPSSIHNQGSKPFYQQIILPAYLSNTNNISHNDRLNNIHTKRWIGNCSTNPPRLLDVSNSPYSIHRKIMYQELSRQYPTTVDPLKSAKSKQQININKGSSKTPITANVGTNLTSQESFLNDDVQSSRLFDTLSKHVTIKAEPIRPSNNFLNNATNTLTSWQKYWTSTHAQRRRKEANEPEPEPVLYRPKREQPFPSQTHFVVLRDSTYPYNELQQNDSRTPLTRQNSSSPTKLYISTTTSDKQISSTKENDINKTTNQISTIEFVASSLIPSTVEINPSRATSKTSTAIRLKSIDKDEEKCFIERSILLSSSQFKTDTQIIQDVSEAQTQSRPFTTTVYKLSLPPSAQPITRKKSLTRGRTESKSGEKKERRISSASKRKRQTSINRKSVDKSQPSQLSTIMTTIPKSKYSQKKWAEPYVGLRTDPPPPPCSPSLFVWLQDSDQEDSDIPFEKSEFYEHNLAVKILES